MTISVTSAHIASSARGTILCPLFVALQSLGWDVRMVGVGTEHTHSDTPCGRIYYVKNSDSLIQMLPLAVVGTLKSYDKTGELEPFEFELPDV